MNDVKRRSFAAGYLLGLAGLPVAAAPVQFDNDNKLMMLGCRLGYIIRTHMGKGNEETDIPVGVLISSDGYILTDNNGVYLIAKEDS